MMVVRVVVRHGGDEMTSGGGHVGWECVVGKHLPPPAGNTLHHRGILSPVPTRVCMQLKDCAIFP